MDKYTFFSEIIKSFTSLPVSIVIILLILRKPLSASIPNLNIFDVDVKGIKIRLEKELTKAKGETRTKKLEEYETPKKMEETPECKLNIIYTNVNKQLQLAELSPRAAILSAWIDIESVLLIKAERHKININVYSFSQSKSNDYIKTILKLVDDLIMIDIIKSNLRNDIRRLCNVRNVVINARDNKISIRNAEDFVTLSSQIICSLEKLDDSESLKPHLNH